MNFRSRLVSIRTGGRLVVIALVLLAMLAPRLPGAPAELELTILLDESLSMPRGFNDGAWQRILDQLAATPERVHYRLLRFAANPVLEPGEGSAPIGPDARIPRSAALDGSVTNIASALRAALQLLPATRPAVMLLVSDTNATEGDTEAALQLAHRAGVPLYLLAPPLNDPTERFSLQDLQMPPRVSVGEEVPVLARVESQAGGEVSLTLEIDGRIADRRLLSTRPGEPAVAAFHFVPPRPGVMRVSVGLTPNSTGNSVSNSMDSHGGSLQSRTRAVNVLGPAPLLYVSFRGESSPLVSSLRLAGETVITTTPAGLAAQKSRLQQVGAIVLDDLAIDDMSDSSWQALLHSVRDKGKGLAVLGGPRSFGAGAYRHSALEQILPVTAEAVDPQEPASVLFVLDKSGSMGRQRAAPSRLALARQAVAASAAMLLPGDQLGIIAFAAEAETRMQLGPRQANSAGVAAALALDPGGGTQLLPALRLAAEQLGAVTSGKRLLVLVTDGFTGDENLRPIARKLRELGVTVIALAVGTDANLETLRRLTDFNDGRVLSVTSAATLPRLMPAAIARQRAPRVAQPTLPLPVRAPPFQVTATTWPPLSAYMVTKARPTADVFLQSGHGDPLFASGLAGAGRVAVLPAGLGSWASAWWQWPEFGTFLGGLVRWLQQGNGSENLSLSVLDNSGQLLFTVDMRADGDWNSEAQPQLLVDDPAGLRTELHPVLQAPGRYQAQMAATHTGLYQITVHAGDSTLRHALYRDAGREYQLAADTAERREAWRQKGWIRPWPLPGTALAAESPDNHSPRLNPGSGWRQGLLALALLSYLLLLIFERGLVGPLLRALRAWFSR